MLCYDRPAKHASLQKELSALNAMLCYDRSERKLIHMVSHSPEERYLLHYKRILYTSQDKSSLSNVTVVDSSVTLYCSYSDLSDRGVSLARQ